MKAASSLIMFRFKKSKDTEETGNANNANCLFSYNLNCYAKLIYKPSSVPPQGGDDHLSRTAVTDGL